VHHKLQKYTYIISDVLSVTRATGQWSSVGPASYILIKSDLRPLSSWKI